MESTIDLILKGHFQELKNKVNDTGSKEGIKTLIMAVEEAILYLQKNQDKESKALINKLTKALYMVNPTYTMAIEMEKKPMRKAGKKKISAKQKKAM